MVRNPSICFLSSHWSIPVQPDWSSPQALAHNPWPISQWGVKTLHNLNMHINSQRFVNITELMVDLGPRTQPGLNRCIYPAVHLGFENSSRKICFSNLPHPLFQESNMWMQVWCLLVNVWWAARYGSLQVVGSQNWALDIICRLNNGHRAVGCTKSQNFKVEGSQNLLFYQTKSLQKKFRFSCENFWETVKNRLLAIKSVRNMLIFLKL